MSKNALGIASFVGCLVLGVLSAINVWSQGKVIESQRAA